MAAPGPNQTRREDLFGETGSLGRGMRPAASLLPSGLYRRPRSLTGSCAWGACGLYRRSGVGPCGPHPAPKAWSICSIAQAPNPLTSQAHLGRTHRL